MTAVARAIYGVFGALATLLSVVVLINPAIALPPDGRSALTTHLIREQGAEGLFIGLMALWCLFNIERRRPVHLALLIFTALFALIHWSEYFQDRRGLLSPLLNSIPFLAFVVITPRLTGTSTIRAWREGR